MSDEKKGQRSRRKVMIHYLDSLLRAAGQEVFTTMLSFKVVFEPATAFADNGKAQVAGTIGFTGKFNGVAYMLTSASLARQFTGSLLGLSDHEIEGDDMVNDAVGELTNMLSGYMKSRLCDKGLACVISIPTVLRGRGLKFEPVSHTDRCAVSFRCGAESVSMGVIVKKTA
jgi:CheY-specific phosphatase CheX